VRLLNVGKQKDIQQLDCGNDGGGDGGGGLVNCSLATGKAAGSDPIEPTRWYAPLSVISRSSVLAVSDGSVEPVNPPAAHLKRI
jgi:hypothetical protein